MNFLAEAEAEKLESRRERIYVFIMVQLYSKIIILFCISLIMSLSSCDGSGDNNNISSSKSGSVVTVHFCNATTKSGHYVYRVKIDDNFTGKCILDKSVNLKNCIDTNGSTVGTSRDYEITADPKYKKNNWTVTIYAKGGTIGSKSNTINYQPYSNNANKIYCYWHGTYISENYGD